MKKLLIALLTIILISSFIFSGCAKQVPATEAKPTTLVFTTVEPPGSFWVVNVFEPMFAEIEKSTGGRVKVEAHWGGELSSSMDAYDAAVRGTVGLANYMPQEQPTRFPMTDIMSFASYDSQVMRRGRILWDLIQEFSQMQAEYKDAKLLWVGAMSNGYIATVKKPIRTLDDLKGLKMLTAGKWIGEREKALGMVPTAVAPQDMFPSLQKGVLDGSTVALFLLRDFQLGQVLKYVVPARLSVNPWAISMNLKTWNSLPSDIQKTIKDIGVKYVDIADEVFFKVDAERKAAAPKEFGTEFNQFSTADMAQIVKLDKPVWDTYAAELEAKKLPGKKLVERYLALEKKYAAPEYAIK